jgi:hypothetical protein
MAVPLMRACRGEKWVYSVSQSPRGRAGSSGERKRLQLRLGCRPIVLANREPPARPLAWVEAQDAACSAYVRGSMPAAPGRRSGTSRRPSWRTPLPSPTRARCPPSRPQRGASYPVCCSAIGSCLSMRPSFGSGGGEGCSPPYGPESLLDSAAPPSRQALGAMKPPEFINDRTVSSGRSEGKEPSRLYDLSLSDLVRGY